MYYGRNFLKIVQFVIFSVEVLVVQKNNGWRGKYGDNVLYMINTNIVDGVSLNESNLTFNDFTLRIIKFFYLERDAVVSDCKIKFNIPVLPSGSLSVQKKFLGESMYDDDYEFILYDVTNGDEVVLVDTKYVIGDNECYTDSNGRFTLRKDEVATFKLTNYHKYYVAEMNPSKHAVSYNCTLDGEECSEIDKTNEFTINPDSSYRVIFTNKGKAYSLKVSRNLYDDNDSELFQFKIKLKNKDGKVISIPNNIESLNEYVIEDNDGSIIYSLRNNDYIVINDIPIDTVVNLQGMLHDGYVTIINGCEVDLKNGDSYEFVMDDDKDITVYNIASVVLPATGGAGIWSYLVVGIIFMFMSLWFGFKYLFKLKKD